MKPVNTFVFVLGICLVNTIELINASDLKKQSSESVQLKDTNIASHHGNKNGVNDTINNESYSIDSTRMTTNNFTADNSTILQISELSTSIQPTNIPLSTTVTSTPVTTAALVSEIGSWNVTDSKGNICILLKGEVELELFNSTDNQSIRTFSVPANAPSQGNCTNEFIELKLPNNSSLKLSFKSNTTNSKFYLNALQAVLMWNIGNYSFVRTFDNSSIHLFETPLEQSYFCAPEWKSLVGGEGLEHLMLKVSNFQVQAFKNSSTDSFDTAMNCEAHYTPDIVPIIVGCALAVLVILVLVAYLISRRRSQSRGYFSM